MLEEDRKRRQFEEQKQKLRLLSSVKPKVSVSPRPVHFTTLMACRLLVFVTFRPLDPHLLLTQTAEKSRDDALEAIKGNLDGFSRDAKMYPNPSSQTKKPGTLISNDYLLFLSFSRSVEMPPSESNGCIGGWSAWWLLSCCLTRVYDKKKIHVIVSVPHICPTV